MRLDRFLCENSLGSRSQVKQWIKKGLVTVNDTIIRQPEYKVDEESDAVFCQGQAVFYRKYVYYMLNKPAGTVTAREDNLSLTVMSLMKDAYGKDLSPVGRLDKDTEGLLLITNDGLLAHRLLSPKNHVPKTYFVTLRECFTPEQEHALAEGVDIGEKKVCMPAQAEVLDSRNILLTIHEGKFHQVKRMMKAVGNEVVYLKRVRFGSLSLDATLAPGEYRSLSDTEVAEILKQAVQAVD